MRLARGWDKSRSGDNRDPTMRLALGKVQRGTHNVAGSGGTHEAAGSGVAHVCISGNILAAEPRLDIK